MERREFLAASAALAAAPGALTLPLSEPPLAGKDSRLKAISTDPLVLETPDELLAAARVTALPALFVRNHHGAKPFLSMESRLQEGEIEITGLVANPQKVPLLHLSTLRQDSVEMVLQCTGNFRSLFSKISPVKGTQWNKGGVGNVEFSGVPIEVFFKSIGLQIDPKAKFLTAEAADQPEKPTQHDFEKSIPLDVALSRGLLATRLNGELIPGVHGGPVRLVIPGYYGSMQVKWLTKLRLEATESTSYYQSTDYRTPTRLIQAGEAFSINPSNSSPAMDMRINSRILFPSDGAKLTANETATAKGVVWNDGSASITSVELSIDGGVTWKATTLAQSAGPYAFREWSLPITLAAGRHELWVRAIDALGRTQPLDGGLFWNPGGYSWNGVEKIAVTIA